MSRPRLLLSFLLFVTAGAQAAVTPADPPVPPLLLEALTKLSQDFDRWAYTETRNFADPKGHPRGETIIRFDPSKPYAEQYTPLKIDGQPPTARQVADYRKRGEKRGERLEREAAEGKAPGSELARFRFGGDNAAIDLAHATIESETATTVAFNVPLRNDGHGTIPVDKFELIARVNKEQHAFENVSLRVRDSFRLKLVVKVQGGAASVEFGTADPKRAPVVVRASGEGTASILFMTFGGSFDVRHTDFQRVKPYSERFGVRIGPLKALDF